MSAKTKPWTLEIYDTCHPVVILRVATLDGYGVQK